MSWKKSFSFALLVLLVLATTSTRAEEPTPVQPWRSPDNGGINALYLYLRVNGVSCYYADLLEEQARERGTRKQTVATLALIAATHGVPLKPVSLRVEELFSCQLPVIVHVDGESPEAGAFQLIFTMGDKGFDYLDGSSVTFQKIDIADFRRVWSGVALLPVARRPQDALYCLIAFATGVLLPAVVRFSRWRSCL